MQNQHTSLRQRVTDWLLGLSGAKPYRSYRIRLLVQSTFAGICVMLGFRLSRFYTAAKAGDLPLPQ